LLSSKLLRVMLNTFCSNSFVCPTNAQMSNIYSALYDPSHERKHPFDLNQWYGSLSTFLPNVITIYTWTIVMVHYLLINNNVPMYMNGSHEDLQLLVLKWFYYFGNHQQSPTIFKILNLINPKIPCLQIMVYCDLNHYLVS